MFMFWHPSLYSLFVFVVSVAAQNNTNSTDYSRCPFNFQNLGPQYPVNSTGSAVVQWSDSFARGNFANGEWSLTTTFNDSGQRSTDYGRFVNPIPGYLTTFLTYPKSVNASVCVYLVGGFNASSTGDNSPGTSCEGILSNACTTAITKRVQAAGLRSSRCDSFPMEPFSECDGRERNGTDGSPGWTTKPIDLSNDTCAITSPPGGVSVPEGSQTISIFSTSAGPVHATEQGMTDFTYYDQIVRQPIVWVLAARGLDGTAESQIVCVTPKNLTAGSRVPQGPWPPQSQGTSPNGTNTNSNNTDTSSAGKLNSKSMAVIAMVLACAVSLLLP